MPPQDDTTATTPPAGDQPVADPMGQPAAPADDQNPITTPPVAPAEPTMGGEEPAPATPPADEQTPA